MIKRATVGLLVLFSCSMLGARDCVWDSWAGKVSQQKPPPNVGGGTVLKCVPLECDLLCDGTDAHPLLSGTCPLSLSENTVIDAGLAQWFLDTKAGVCPALNPMVDKPVHFTPPAQYICNTSGCKTDPNKLPPTCNAFCTVSNGIPDVQGCPDPATNPAMAAFLMDLSGIVCNELADTNPYTLDPDPSLVDTSTCL